MLRRWPSGVRWSWEGYSPVFLTETDAIIRLVVGALLGGLIGLEREVAQKPAGLRTNMLVCLGATLFMVTSLLLGNLVTATTGDVYDPSRIASTIVQGIGFLGGGVIFATRGQVKGVTTAAGIWVAAGVGMATGAGFFQVAVAGTVIALITLRVLTRLEVPERNASDEDDEAPADDESSGSGRQKR
jgi:putative Mg2+ transporter-C (MgtC) family protein